MTDNVDTKEGMATPAETPEPNEAIEVPKEPEGSKPDGEEPTSLTPKFTALIEQYDKLARYNGIARSAFPVLVLGLIITFIVSIWMSVSSAFPQDSVTEQSVKAGEELLPVINKAIKGFVDDVDPQLADEFTAQLAINGEKMAETVGKQIERLDRTNKEFITNQIKASIASKKREHRELLLKAMPELKDDEKTLNLLTDRVNAAFEQWTVKYMLQMMEDYYLAMAKINDTVIRNYKPKTGKVGAQNYRVHESEMLELFLELLNAAYTEPVAAPTPTADASATEAPVTPEPSEAGAPPASDGAPVEGTATDSNEPVQRGGTP